MNQKLKIKMHEHDTAGPIHPAVFTVFGATGDLALRYLIPTLLHLEQENILPPGFKVVAAGRREISDAEYFKLLQDSGVFLESGKDAIKRFKDRTKYVSASFDEPGSFIRLKQAIDFLEKGTRGHVCFDRFYYFAVAPKYFSAGAKILSDQGLLETCSTHKRTLRIMIEKPFGENLKTARILDKDLHKYFSENQIYRVDHYLGKESVQNITALRFANSFLEPVWNNKYVDHIEISLLESDGIGARGRTYDEVGALKDVMQNHILQLLALIAMEKPKDDSAQALHESKSVLLKSLKKFTSSTLAGNVLRGQYASSGKIKAYLQDLGAKASSTETYLALKTEIKNQRWSGVPLFLRTGKRLAGKTGEISVHFKNVSGKMFGGQALPNVLSVYLQPRESISMQVNNKIPGLSQLRSGLMIFDYIDQFMTDSPPAYERLFLDFFKGEQSAFVHSSEVEASWSFIDSISENWNSKNCPLQSYPAGSAGPMTADKLIKASGREWRTN